MLGACIDLKSCHRLSADGVSGEHTANCKLHSLFGLGSHKGLILNSLHTADISGMMVIVLLLKLFAGKDSLVGVDDDDELTAVNVRGEFGTMLTSENGGSCDSGLSERLSGCVDDVPSAVKRLFFCHKSRHEISSDKFTFFQPHNYITVTMFCQALFQKKSEIFKITFKCSPNLRFLRYFLAFSPPRHTKILSSLDILNILIEEASNIGGATDRRGRH